MPVDFAKHRVYARQKWDEDWELQAQLYCDALTFTCSPDIASAVLSYRTGEVLGYGETAFANRDPLDLRDWFVKIEIWPPDPSGLSFFDNPDPEAPAPVRWYGVVVDDSRDLEGDHGADQPAGPETLRALGLEFLLERTRIHTSKVADGEGGTKTIGRAIGFNVGAGHAADRKFVPNGGGVGEDGETFKIFAATLEDAQPWTGLEILQYLLYYHRPVDVVGIPHLTWYLTGEFDHLKAQQPALHTHGRSVKSLLDELMPRHRLCGWRVAVAEEDELITIDSFTHTPSDIELADGTTIPATTRTKTLTINDDPQVAGCQLERSTVHAFQRVVAQGEPRGSVFTLSTLISAELTSDWTSAERTAYNAGASASTAYAATSDLSGDDKNQLNRAFRGTPAVERVFRYFAVPDGWNGMTSVSVPAFPKLEADGTLDDTTSEDFWQPGLRLANELPLIAGVDYSSVSEPSDVSASGRTALLKPFLLIEDEDETWRLGDLLPPLEEDADGPARNWTLALSMRPDKLGVIVTVRGDDQHAIAGDDFTAADSFDANWQPRTLDWQKMDVTVYCQHDHFCEGVWPDPPAPDPADIHHTLTIEVPGHRLDYLVANTVLGVDDEGELIVAAGGFIRDDRDKLRAIARLAYEWYGRTRQLLTYTQRRIDPQVEVGDLITTLNPSSTSTKETVNTVVTELSIDLRAGTHSLKTDFAELDVKG